MEKPEPYDLPLPLGQGVYGLAQRDVLHQALLLAVVAEHLLEREALLPALALEALRRTGGRLGDGDVLGAYPRLVRELRERRLPAQALLGSAP